MVRQFIAILICATSLPSLALAKNCKLDRTLPKKIAPLIIDYASSQTPSAELFRWLDKALLCALKDDLAKNDAAFLKSFILSLAKIYPQSLYRVSKEFGIKKIQSLEESPGFTLHQLNSGAVVFVEGEDPINRLPPRGNQTSINVHYLLKMKEFLPWSTGLSDDKVYTKRTQEANSLAHSELGSNFSFSMKSVALSFVGLYANIPKYDSQKIKIIFEPQDLKILTHEIQHIFQIRYPKTHSYFLKLKGGYKDRLKIAQQAFPQFMKTQGTPDKDEKFKNGPVSHGVAHKIALLVKPPQNYGTIAKKLHVNEEYSGGLPADEHSFLVNVGGKNYSVNSEESLYAFVDKGNEYFPMMMEIALTDPTQYAVVASVEEKKAIQKIRDYLFFK